MNTYETLINILDCICRDAPSEYKRYDISTSNLETINHARSRALIHLYLKVSFGLLDFKDREYLITDNSQDAGIDAYYIDANTKKIYFIQSKFRVNANNYENKEIELSEILKMDIDRITDGELKDENGKDYNGKIKQLLRELKNIADIGRYKYEAIILANLKYEKESSLKKITGGFPVQIFDYRRVYKELVFPVVTGTYYNQSELCISLNLSNKSTSSSRINYSVETEYEGCDITVIFVPTDEIGRILYKYKNSILKFNPRCFLELRSNNINKEIYNTITTKSTNEFALFNNGITILSDDTSFNEKIGQKDKAQIVIENPQIINGGQTAYTLSRIYEDTCQNKISKDIFKNKEVLLKIITFSKNISKNESHKLKLIESISKATNRQSPVSDADRRSNDKVQINLQNSFFEQFGIYYERKKGEYADGIREKYINRNQVIDREQLLRLAMACNKQASQARRNSERVIFEENNFTKNLNDAERVIEYYYAYLCHQYLSTLEKEISKNKDVNPGIYGYALRYGKYAVTSAVVANYFIDRSSITKVEEHVKLILNRWTSFENHISELELNKSYFTSHKDVKSGTLNKNYNFDGYYKGKTLNIDLNYFNKSI